MAHDIEIKSGPGGRWLYAPKNKAGPGIIFLHGSEGGFAGWSNWQAIRFAYAGFCTIAPGYSVGGNLWHAGDIKEVELDQTVELLKWMRESALTTGGVGLYGASRGAEHALLLTSLMAQERNDHLPDAVAVHAPPNTIADAFIAKDFDPHDHEVWDPARRPWKWCGSSENLRPTTPIEIERYDGPLFISHGEQDNVWTVQCTERLEKRLIAAGREPEVHYYPDEDHGLRPEAENLQHDRLVAFFKRSLVFD